MTFNLPEKLSTPNITLRIKLASHFTMYNIDEY